MSLIFALNEAIRTPELPMATMVAEAQRHVGKEATSVAIVLLGGMAPAHSVLSGPFPMTKWIIDTGLFDLVFLWAGPHIHLFSRRSPPAADEPPLSISDFDPPVDMKELPTCTKMIQEQHEFMEGFLGQFRSGTLARFCAFSYSIGGKLMFRIWPRLRRLLGATQPQAQLLSVVMAAGFHITEAGVRWLESGLSLPEMQRNDRRFPVLAPAHGKGLANVLLVLRYWLFGPAGCRRPDEDHLYATTPADRALVLADPTVHVVLSAADLFYPPHLAVWTPADAPSFSLPPAAFDLSSLPDSASLADVSALLDLQTPSYARALAASPGAKLSLTNGAHIPLASGSFRHLSQLLVQRILALYFQPLLARACL